jgi:molecular chaperone GrpE
LAKDAEHEDREHVIDDDSSWEDMLRRLGDDAPDGGGGAERAAAGGGDVPGKREVVDEGGGAETGAPAEADGESGDDARVEAAEAGGTDRPAERIDDAAHAGGRGAAVQKRTKKSRKELLDILREREDALERSRSELEKMKQEFAIKEDKLIRMVAEFENYKKRTRREWELHQKRANAELIRDILGILDDFERAFESPDDSGEHFRSGVQLIYSGLLDVMVRAGLNEIEAENRPFDPQYHEAMGELESDEVEEGHVMQVVQKGYMLRDQLLRPAKVIVAKEREPESG